MLNGTSKIQFYLSLFPVLGIYQGTNKILGSIVISGSQNRSVYRCTLEEKGIGGKKEQGEGQPGNLTVLFCVLYILFVSCNKKISSS